MADEWVWQGSGTSLTYAPWGQDAPLPNRHCAYMWNGLMFAASACSHVKNFFCEKISSPGMHNKDAYGFEKRKIDILNVDMMVFKATCRIYYLNSAT